MQTPVPLEAVRVRIDAIDEALLSLISERAHLALEAGAVKRASNLPITHPEREAEVLGRMRRRNEGPLTGAAVDAVFGAIVEACRGAQRLESDDDPAALAHSALLDGA